MNNDEYEDYVSAEDYDALKAEFDHLVSLLKNCHPIVKAHAGASHMLDGFRPRRNQYDDLVDQVDAAIDAAMRGSDPCSLPS